MLLCFSWPSQLYTHLFLPGCSPNRLCTVCPNLLLYSSLPPRYTQSVFPCLLEALAIQNWKNLAFHQCDSGICIVWHHSISLFCNPSFHLVISLLPVLRYQWPVQIPYYPGPSTFLPLSSTPGRKAYIQLTYTDTLNIQIIPKTGLFFFFFEKRRWWQHK